MTNRLRRLILAAALLGGGTAPLLAQTWPFPWPEERIARYTARRTTTPIVVDGRLDEAAWRAAERSPRFADLVGGQPGIHDTRAAVLWDDTYLYVGYWIEEPFVEATLTERDSPIYKNNDVELFIAGRDAYYEFEINSFGTIYEVLFVWEKAFESSGYAKRAEFDRTRPGVRPFNGVGFKNHPRGPRIGYWNWDMPGLETAVHVDGTINDNKDRDRGWTVELRIPWRSLEPLAMPDKRALPPKEGDEWRMDFSRFNQYKEAPPAKDPGGWAWSPHGVWDSHMPELFTRVRFSTEPVVPAAGGNRLPPDAPRPIAAGESLWAEELTFMDVREAVRSGTTTIIIGTGGVEQNGPYLAGGKHNFVLQTVLPYIAREIGHALIAPIVKFVPEGEIEPTPTGHMRYAGTISVEAATFEALLTDICRSYQAHGFTDIILLGDSGGNQAGMESVAAALNRKWAGGKTRVHYLREYYYRDKWSYDFLKSLGITQIDKTPASGEAADRPSDWRNGIHDDIYYEAQAAVVDPNLIRADQRTKAGLLTLHGVDLAPMSRTVEIGRQLAEYRAKITAKAFEASKRGQ